MNTQREKPHTYSIYFVLAFAMIAAFTDSVQAWQGMKTPPLHTDGRFLKDPSGKNVLLHGWMQPTETWFNGGGRWYSNPSDWTNPGNVAGLLNYLCDAATLMSDGDTPRYGRDHGWYCSFVRVNTDSIGGWTSEQGLVSAAQFNGWIQNFVVPYADHLRSRGLYLVLSATGPINTPNNGTRNAGVVEQQRLITFWQTVANAPGVKNADNIMFELMNEPVEIETFPGSGVWGMGSSTYFLAFRNWIQPVINAIRNTGADNVIWVPTLEWQGSPHQHAQYPFTGTNCGVAAHYYPAYGGVRDDAAAVQNLWNSQYKPAADLWPMIITEMSWFETQDPWSLVYGHTWGFGNAVKNAIDNQGNVSYIVGFLGDLLDNLNDYLPEDCALSSHECAPAYFDWLPTYIWAAPDVQTPYGGTAWAIPGIIEGEDYDFGGEGAAYHDTTGGNTGGQYRSENVDVEICGEGGYDVGWIDSGEWLEYTVNVATTGTYDIIVRVASINSNGVFHIEFNGSDVTGLQGVPNTGNWQTYTDVIIDTVNLNAGDQVMRIYVDTGGWNLNNVTINLATLPSGTYRILSRHSGKAIDAFGAGTANGTQIIQWTYGGGTNQQWIVTNEGNDQYSIIGVQSGRCIDISNWGTTNGTDVLLWDYFGGTNQKYYITPTDNGYYRISPTHAPNSCLDVEGVSGDDGALIHLWTYLGGNNQQWDFLSP